MTQRDADWLDSADADEILQLLQDRRPGYAPDWRPTPDDPGLALSQVAARQLQIIAQHLHHAPDQVRLAFFNLLGIQRVLAQSARAVVVFRMADGAADALVPKGTRLTAAGGPTGQVVFETIEATALAAAKLVQVATFWPGRDQWIDHTAAVANNEPLHPFRVRELQNTPHAIYIAHDTLLALAGEVHLKLEFSLSTPGSRPLPIDWQYWDGSMWRDFLSTIPKCEEEEECIDGTEGLTRSGTICLEAKCTQSVATTTFGITSHWLRGSLAVPLPPDPLRVLPQIDLITLKTRIERPLFADAMPNGLLPDKAFADQLPIDLTKSFFPFGTAPRPGSTFYVKSNEILSKPTANVMVWLTLAATEPPIQGDVTCAVLKCEYWNGRQWVDLETEISPQDIKPDDTRKTPWCEHHRFVIKLTVPEDIQPTKVNDEQGYWLRIRIVSGAFGRIVTVKVDGKVATTFFIPQPPVVETFKFKYIWEKGPYPPEHTLTYNNFRYQDRTPEVLWPGSAFAPFETAVEGTPALYLGFDKPLPVGEVGIDFDIEERREVPQGPALVWQYWDGGSWEHLDVRDETAALRNTGLVSVIGAADSQPVAQFGEPYHWIRAALKEDGVPGEPTVRAIRHNATWVAQQQTIINEPLGIGTGIANQVFTFRQIPVLEGEQIEVRESFGPPAEAQWRIIAQQLAGGDARFVRSIEAQLAREGPQTEVVAGDLRLVRNRKKQVVEVWVRWRRRRQLFFSGPNDRHYMLDRALGRARCGDNEHGRIVPAQASVVARVYQTGGGSAGNVAAGAISQFLGAIGGLEGVASPRRAEGGSDGEAAGAFQVRAASSVPPRGRCVTVSDYEALAREASADVAVAHALPGRAPDGVIEPGWVGVVVIPSSGDPRPWPSFGLRRTVLQFLLARGPADVAAAGGLYVTGPDYQPIDISTTLTVAGDAEAGEVATRAREALEEFLHPLHGGRDGQGWPPDGEVFLSHLAPVLESLDGVDYVSELALMVDGIAQGFSLKVSGGRIVAAGELDIKVSTGTKQP